MQHIINKLGKNISLDANPSYYDYIHTIKLKFIDDNYGSFELVDGGGQSITGKYNGDFQIENSNIINFTFREKINIYLDTKNQIYFTKQVKYNIKEEECEHFNGYCKYISDYTIELDSSPFDFCTLKSDRKQTLYNMLNENDFPLTFYTNLNIVPCDVLYEREKRDKEYKINI